MLDPAVQQVGSALVEHVAASLVGVLEDCAPEARKDPLLGPVLGSVSYAAN